MGRVSSSRAVSTLLLLGFVALSEASCADECPGANTCTTAGAQRSCTWTSQNTKYLFNAPSSASNVNFGVQGGVGGGINNGNHGARGFFINATYTGALPEQFTVATGQSAANVAGGPGTPGLNPLGGSLNGGQGIRATANYQGGGGGAASAIQLSNGNFFVVAAGGGGEGISSHSNGLGDTVHQGGSGGLDQGGTGSADTAVTGGSGGTTQPVAQAGDGAGGTVSDSGKAGNPGTASGGGASVACTTSGSGAGGGGYFSGGSGACSDNSVSGAGGGGGSSFLSSFAALVATDSTLNAAAVTVTYTLPLGPSGMPPNRRARQRRFLRHRAERSNRYD